MPCGWEGNRRSGVALSSWLCVTGFSDLSTYTRSYGLRKGDEHPIYTPDGVWQNLPYSVYLTVFQKKRDTKLMAVTLLILNRFSNFFSLSDSPENLQQSVY